MKASNYIQERDLENYNEWRRSQGLGPVPRNFPKEPHTVLVSEISWAQVKDLASELGMSNKRGRNAGDGSVSSLLEALGQGLFDIHERIPD